MALGVGGEWLLFSNGSKSLDPRNEGAPRRGPTVKRDFSVLSPQVSLNFGGRDGWSYISGGIGWARFTTELEAAPVADPDGSVRLVSTTAAARAGSPRNTSPLRSICASTRSIAQEPTTGRPAYGGRRMMVFSAGVSFK